MDIAISENSKKTYVKTKTIEDTPDWFDKELDEQLLTEEEIARLESGVL